MLGAIDFGVADDGERTGDEQAAQIAIASFADTAEPVLAAARVLPRHECRSRPRNYVLIGRLSGRQQWRLEQWLAPDRRPGQ